jgi:hypothetical protein
LELLPREIVILHCPTALLDEKQNSENSITKQAKSFIELPFLKTIIFTLKCPYTLIPII